MNMKTLAVLVLMGLSLSAFAQSWDDGMTEEGGPPSVDGSLPGRGGMGGTMDQQTFRRTVVPTGSAGGSTNGNQTTPPPVQAAGAPVPQTLNDITGVAGQGKASKCAALISAYENNKAPGKTMSADVVQCKHLDKIGNGLEDVSQRENPPITSMDKTISCVRKASYTIDFEDCQKALAHYNFVVNADVAMDLQQKIRTDLKNKNIQDDASRKAAAGDYQTGALDAGIESHKHMKQMNTEKMAAYSLAVAALVRAYTIIPGEKKAHENCAKSPASSPTAPEQTCAKTIKDNKPVILANQEAKAGLGLAIAKFTAKGIAAGIAMGQNRNAAAKIEEAKKNFEDPTEDMMMERCVFNPTDPACAIPGNRVAGQSFSGGEFGLGAGGGNNAFDMNPEGENLVEVGAETNLDGEGVSGINSPFAEEAKNANKILDPAAAAQMQASGGAAGGGGSGSGGGGGGGASLGSDLAGADKDGDKEAQIKTNKVSGVYGASGGGGYKGVGKGKDDANPFASLFDAKSNGGIEEDRSIASGDIDGAASGLFQKISKRYSQIQADKRIETKNLE